MKKFVTLLVLVTMGLFAAGTIGCGSAKKPAAPSGVTAPPAGDASEQPGEPGAKEKKPGA